MEPIPLIFYALNQNLYPEAIRFNQEWEIDPDQKSFKIWENIIKSIVVADNIVGRNYKAHPETKSYSSKFDEAGVEPYLLLKDAPLLYEKPHIVVLFVKMKQLSDPSTYHNLVDPATHSLRRIVEKKNWRPNDHEFISPPAEMYYQPIITIGYEDIMDLYTEKDEGELSEDLRHLESLRLDSRFKFFDSSIWHRYVPVYPRKGTFRESLMHVLKKMAGWHKDYLYASNAARAYLEFQLRMMKNSYIAKIGRTGHYEVVTPFKFHSEKYIEAKIYKIEQDLGQFSKLNMHLVWRLLLIDDYATRSISSNDDLCRFSKKALIEDILVSNTIKVEVVAPGQDDEIIDVSINKLKKGIYDVLLLDYLLGSTSKRKKKREYGHDFMVQLRRTYEQSAAALKIGPLGKYWICPISSFPYALKDKLWQLGIHAYDDLWRLSDGGDPICTPALFKYNLLSLFKRQVEESYFSVEELMRWCKRLDDINDHERWAKIALRELKINKLRQESLERDEKDGSAFAASMQLIIPVAYKDFMEAISDFLAEFEKWNIKKDSRNKIENSYKKLVQGKWPEGYKSAISAFRLKIHKFVYAGEHVLKHIIRRNKNITKLEFREKSMETIPASIASCEKLQAIDFSYNKLRTLPKELAGLKSLRELNLSHNQFTVFPKELELLKDLHKLYLTGNAFELSNYEATSNREVRKMIEEGLKSDIQTIRKLISKGDLQKAADILFEIAGDDKAIANRVVVQSDQIHLLFSAKEGGTDFLENIAIRRNNIIENLLSIVNDIEKFRNT